MFKHYKGYNISPDGNIVGVSGRKVIGTKNSKGYLQTTGTNNKKYLIHRLIAECWIPCPGNFELYQVNHIDGNKENNCVKNLEWLTPEQHIEKDCNRRIINNNNNNLDCKDNRLEWNEYFISIANLISSRSACKRLKVGCVLVKDNRVISSGYNGFLPGAPHKSRVRDNHEQSTVHAEQNCIADCAKRGVSTNDADAFITHYPCINCCKILLAAGIKHIYFKENYKNDPIVDDLLREANINAIKL